MKRIRMKRSGLSTRLTLGWVMVTILVVATPFILDRVNTGRWWIVSGSPDAIRTALQRLRLDAMRQPGRCGGASPGAADGLLACLGAVERSVACGEYDIGAEAAQHFQWEALMAQASGAIARDTASRLITDAQVLCENLWAHERGLIG